MGKTIETAKRINKLVSTAAIISLGLITLTGCEIPNGKPNNDFADQLWEQKDYNQRVGNNPYDNISIISGKNVKRKKLRN